MISGEENKRGNAYCNVKIMAHVLAGRQVHGFFAMLIFNVAQLKFYVYNV